MTLCNRKDCKFKGIDLPADQFVGEKGRVTKGCLDCRKRQQKEWSRSYSRKNVRQLQGAVRVGSDAIVPMRKIKEVLEIGDPPKFNFDWEQKRYEAWLKEICASVIHG